MFRLPVVVVDSGLAREKPRAVFKVVSSPLIRFGLALDKHTSRIRHTQMHTFGKKKYRYSLLIYNRKHTQSHRHSPTGGKPRRVDSSQHFAGRCARWCALQSKNKAFHCCEKS